MSLNTGLTENELSTVTSKDDHQQRRSFKWWNVLFGGLAVFGQVGQNVSLPLWIDASTGQCGNTTLNCTAQSIDSYFVYTFACLSFVIIFGVMLVIIRIVTPNKLGQTERTFPVLPLFFIGFFDALNGVLVVFASSGKRTPPYLQAILGNFVIPLTVIVRLAILRKKPTVLKACTAAAVFLALFICVIPTFVPSLGGNMTGGAHDSGRYLWPMCFMLGFVPAAIMNVLEEKWLKYRRETSTKQLNLIYFLFITSCFQALSAAAFFWVDIIPGYGNAPGGLPELGEKWKYGVSCFFGGEGCSAESGLRGSIFIGMYVLSYIGTGLLLRYAEGATLLAIVVSLVTPCGFLFWTLFNEVPFKFQPSPDNRTWFALGSLAIMAPAIFLYNWKNQEDTTLKDDRRLLIDKAITNEYRTDNSGAIF